MSTFNNIDKTLRKALNDIGTGFKIVLENEAFNPATDLFGETWLEAFQVPSSVSSLGKDAQDENTGVYQVSILTKNVNDGPRYVGLVADAIASQFVHGTVYTDFAVVFINQTSRSAGRVDGGFYRVDMSINWSCYVDRPTGRPFTSGFDEGFE